MLVQSLAFSKMLLSFMLWFSAFAKFSHSFAKIEYWQKAENQERLESIARAGREYVRFNFNKQIVATHLLADLLKANHSQNFKKTE